MNAVSPVQSLLERLHARHRDEQVGAPADYIPELAAANPDLFGICLVTAGGITYEIGDTRQEFSIQSISKPLTYALALETLGERKVREHVDVEPSGDVFNSITLDPRTGVPPNPMVNAGAITTTSLIRPEDGAEPIDRILAEYSAFAGRQLTIDEKVFRSENETGHRNRAIAYLLKNAGVLADEVEPAVETYFRQCSTLVDCRDLAVIATTLAAGGVNPLTGRRVLGEETVRNVLSVMASCGMYDAAGDWLYNVGLPAKSGVAGGVIAVLPGQVGMAVFSPPLDAHGNSVRGVKVCEDLSKELHLHVMSSPRQPPPPIRNRLTCAESRSRRMRPDPEQEVLRRHGSEVRVFELQGEITFAASEIIASAVLGEASENSIVILDFSAVRAVDEIVVPILGELIAEQCDRGGKLVLAGVDRDDAVAATLAPLASADGPATAILADLDHALEWGEDALIARYLPDAGVAAEIELAEHDAARGMSADQVRAFSASLERRVYPEGSPVYSSKDTDVDEMLLIAKGKLSILNGPPVEGHEAHRLATISPGMTLGEVALLSGTSRIGYSHADTEVVAFVLTGKELNRLRASDPALVATFFENLLRMQATRMAHLRRHL